MCGAVDTVGGRPQPLRHGCLGGPRGHEGLLPGPWPNVWSHGGVGNGWREKVRVEEGRGRRAIVVGAVGCFMLGAVVANGVAVQGPYWDGSSREEDTMQLW
jgi:hypothetical protein